MLQYDRYSLNLNTIQKYLDEVLECTDVLDDVVEGVKIVILWRGHFPLTFSCFKKQYSFKLPFHSMLAFSWGILLKNNFDRFGSFICFWFAWVLFGILEFQRNNPNPWKRPRTYIELLGIFIFNKSFASHRIDVNENIQEIMEYDEDRAEKVKLRKEAIETMRIQNEHDAKQMEKEIDQLDAQSNEKGVSVGMNQLMLTPFKDILDPVQSSLYTACVYLRVAKSIVTWKDSVASFWVATIALSFSIVTFFVPWTFLFHWAFKILVYVFLGPWMKLVDIYLVENENDMTREERKKKAQAEYKKRYDLIMGESKLIRLLKEYQIKIRDMERYLFGQYAVRVPIFKEERFGAIPLAGGFAVPYDVAAGAEPKIVKRINGQVLTGEMIPTRQNPAEEFEVRKRASEKAASKIPDIISATSLRNDEMGPLLESNDEDVTDVPDKSKPYGSMVTDKVDRARQAVKELSFFSPV